MRRMPCAGMKGVPSSEAPSTSTGRFCPCQCNCSRVSVSLYIDNDLLAFLEAQKGARKLSVIGGGRNDAIRRQFHEPVTDPDRVICCSLRRYRYATGRLSLDRFGEGCRKRCERAGL